MIDYEALTLAYQQSLTSVLRGFRPGDFADAFLETWVPDEDEIKSIRGIFEAASVSRVQRLAVRVGAKTLARVPQAALEAMAARFGAATTTRDGDGDGIVIEVAFEGAKPAAAEAVHAPASLASRPRRAAPGPAVPPVSERTAAYDAAIKAVGPFTHEGVADVAGTVRVAVEHGVATLEACIDAHHVIARARHRGASGDDRQVLELLCRTIESLPIREAADHGAARLELALRGRGGPRVVPGIVSPDNADPRIGACAGTLRSLLAAYARTAGTVERKNEFMPPLRDPWLRATATERLARARDALGATARDLGLVEGAVELATIQGDTRVVIAFAPEMPAARRPTLLFEIERALKERLDDGIAVYLEEMADKNRIRRLVVKPAEAR